jgi:hypothetical protein
VTWADEVFGRGNVIDGVPIQPDYDGSGLDRVAFVRDL